MNYAEISKETFDLLYKSRASLKNSPLPAEVRALAELRTSQINQCAFCCSLHTEEARKLGISQKKLDTLPAWRTSKSFTEEEKAVLEWTEVVTNLDKDRSNKMASLQKFYSEKQIVDLTAAIALMNSLNRVAICLGD